MASRRTYPCIDLRRFGINATRGGTRAFCRQPRARRRRPHHNHQSAAHRAGEKPPLAMLVRAARLTAGAAIAGTASAVTAVSLGFDGEVALANLPFWEVENAVGRRFDTLLLDCEGCIPHVLGEHEHGEARNGARELTAPDGDAPELPAGDVLLAFGGLESEQLPHVLQELHVGGVKVALRPVAQERAGP